MHMRSLPTLLFRLKKLQNDISTELAHLRKQKEKIKFLHKITVLEKLQAACAAFLPAYSETLEHIFCIKNPRCLVDLVDADSTITDDFLKQLMLLKEVYKAQVEIIYSAKKENPLYNQATLKSAKTASLVKQFEEMTNIFSLPLNSQEETLSEKGTNAESNLMSIQNVSGEIKISTVKPSFKERFSMNLFSARKGKKKPNANEIANINVIEAEDDWVIIKPDFIKKIPNEVILMIFSYLQADAQLLLILMKVCKKWNDLANDDLFWKNLAMKEGYLTTWDNPRENETAKNFYHRVCTRDIQIFVKAIGSNKSITCRVKQSDNVDAIKEALHKQENIPKNQQRLIFAGKTLFEGTKLHAAGIRKESTLHLSLTLRGD